MQFTDGFFFLFTNVLLYHMLVQSSLFLKGIFEHFPIFVVASCKSKRFIKKPLLSANLEIISYRMDSMRPEWARI